VVPLNSVGGLLSYSRERLSPFSSHDRTCGETFSTKGRTTRSSLLLLSRRVRENWMLSRIRAFPSAFFPCGSLSLSGDPEIERLLPASQALFCVRSAFRFFRRVFSREGDTAPFPWILSPRFFFLFFSFSPSSWGADAPLPNFIPGLSSPALFSYLSFGWPSFFFFPPCSFGDRDPLLFSQPRSTLPSPSFLFPATLAAEAHLSSSSVLFFFFLSSLSSSLLCLLPPPR